MAYEIKDSGKRQDFSTGSRRDISQGKGAFELISPFALEEVAQIYEGGAVKYGSRNFELGQPLSRYYQSAMRHGNKVLMGMEDENHAAMAMWNWAAFIHTRRLIKLGLLPEELDDMPNYLKRKGVTDWSSYIKKINDKVIK